MKKLENIDYKPCIAVVLIGNRKDSTTYVDTKTKKVQRTCYGVHMLVTKDWVKEDAVTIDVSINSVPDSTKKMDID